MYQIKDWRTDNWAGNRPTWWRDGSDLKFPRTMREAGIEHFFNESEDTTSSNIPNYFAVLGIGILLGMIIFTDVAGFIEHVVNIYQQCIGLIT